MNMMVIDVSSINEAQCEDEVVLIGSQGDEVLGAEKLATWADTISYEIVTRLHPGITRLIVD